MRVCRAGAGFYVTATVTANLMLQCDCCPRSFRHPVSGEFQVAVETPSAENAIRRM